MFLSSCPAKDHLQRWLPARLPPDNVRDVQLYTEEFPAMTLRHVPSDGGEWPATFGTKSRGLPSTRHGQVRCIGQQQPFFFFDDVNFAFAFELLRGRDAGWVTADVVAAADVAAVDDTVAAGCVVGGAVVWAGAAAAAGTDTGAAVACAVVGAAENWKGAATMDGADGMTSIDGAVGTYEAVGATLHASREAKFIAGGAAYAATGSGW
mmetsp:Transcript_2913/g.9082  ORF Transcript_2913/g.9082 Transcript_2913/m.9082 type:complete len:208 (-) Transcript_2913:1116-1739(-)